MGSSTIDRKLILTDGLEIVPMADLPPEIRSRTKLEGGEMVLARAGARTGPLVVASGIAALIEEFRQPKTITDALIGFCRTRRIDPEKALQETLPILKQLIERRLLVWAGFDEAGGSQRRTLAVGEWLDDLQVLRLIQRLEDTEVFQVRLADGRFGALKIGGIESQAVTDRLTHEAEIHLLLDGDPAPAVFSTGEYEGRGYLLLEWRPGSEAMVVTGEWQHRGGTEARRRLLEICCRIVETYGDLHRRGVVHGDVNARNILLDRQGKVTLLDFEDAVRIESVSGVGFPRDRAGVPIYFEPEYAGAVLAGESPPPASAAGEQYALAALVYELIAGVPYLDFDPRWEALLEQIVGEPPAAFAERGLPSWPAIEEVLLRALSKEPDRRFPSVAAMAVALARAELVQPSSRPKTPSRGTNLDEWIRLTTEKAVADGPWLAADGTSPTRASVYEGAAGVALALYRMSRQLEEKTLLELADVWIRRAAEAVDQTDTVENDFEASTFVGSVGTRLVESMIAAAFDQPDRRARALEWSLRSVNDDAGGLDLLDGRSGRLLTLCFLVEQYEAGLPVDRECIRELGGQTLDSLWTDLQQSPPIAETLGDLGMAHGWAGCLFATLRWSRSAGTALTAEMERRLEELAVQSLPVGRGLMWPWRLPLGDTGGPQFMAGWCNGSAGYVFLWTMAAAVLGKESYLELARGAAWNAWESAQRDGSLCCGLVGRAYALLDLFQVTGESLWLDRAHDLAELAMHEGLFESSCPEGLFQGELGLAFLAADLQHPERAWFPFLAPEPGSG